MMTQTKQWSGHEGRVTEKKTHSLSIRGLEAIRGSVMTAEMPFRTDEHQTLGDFIRRLPQGTGPAVSDAITRLARARNFESGEKPTEVRDAMQASLELSMNLQGSPVIRHAEVRTIVQLIDQIVTQGVKNERNGQRGAAFAL